jgi:hypothetical protein
MHYIYFLFLVILSFGWAPTRAQGGFQLNSLSKARAQLNQSIPLKPEEKLFIAKEALKMLRVIYFFE